MMNMNSAELVKADLMAAHVDRAAQILDLELMDRIDLHGPIAVALAACAARPYLSGPCRLPFIERGAGDNSRGAHHIEHARGKAEQEKYDEPPGRDAEPAVDQPAEAGTDQHACNEFAGEPKALGVA